jgi:hypothetical protein
MNLTATLLLAVAGLSPTEAARPLQFDDYGSAYRAATKSGRPLLVILNPADESGKTPISLENVQRTRQRRQLLNDYVVCTVDTSTEAGQKTHQLFGSKQLPRVVVIDKRQKYQIFQTSESLYGQRWTEILETYRKGEPPRVQITPVSHTRSVAQPARQPRQPVQHAMMYRPPPQMHVQARPMCAT